MGLQGVLVRVSSRAADAVGAGLAFASIVWVSSAAGDGRGRAAPVIWLIVGAAAALAVGRWVGDRESSAPYKAIALGVAGALILTLPGVMRSGGAPLGYANDNATLASLGTVAAIAAAAAETGRARAAWWALAAAASLAVLLTGSVAGAACLAVGVTLIAASALARTPVAAVLGGAIGVILVLALTVLIGHGTALMGLADQAAERADLWQAAVNITADHPLRGVGPGRFAELNPVSTDADLRWAHHGYLQVAAETGLVGLSLLLVTLGWCYARLGLAAVRTPHRSVIGAAALTVVALHATVDHVLHAPAIVLTLAVLVGAATSRPAPPVRGTRGSRHPLR